MKKETMKKNPGVAVILSFFWPGLGQIYNGQITKGIGIMFALAILFTFIVPLFSYTSLWIVTLLHDPNKVPSAMWIWIILTIGLTAFSFIIWFSQILFAYKKAKKLNKSEIIKAKINKSEAIHIRPKKEDLSYLETRVEEVVRDRRDFKRWYER
jgi:TM2 domain-containing membrane protein YozV